MSEELQKNITEYINQLKWPFLLVMTFETAATFLDNSWMLIWLANLCFYIYLTYCLIPDKKTGLATIAWIGAITTFLFTLMTNLIELFLNFKFWYIFNLITQPLIYVCLGAGLCSLMFIINKKYFIQKKGGELNGGKESRT